MQILKYSQQVSIVNLYSGLNFVRTYHYNQYIILLIKALNFIYRYPEKICKCIQDIFFQF